LACAEKGGAPKSSSPADGRRCLIIDDQIEPALDVIQIGVSDIAGPQIVECGGAVAGIGEDRRAQMRSREPRGGYAVKTGPVNVDVVEHDVAETAAITELDRIALRVDNIDVGKRYILDGVV